MLQLEIYKLFKRKLAWIAILAIVLYGFYLAIPKFDAEESRTLQYQMKQQEASKGILTDERLENFIKNYRMAKYDPIKDNFVDENGQIKKIKELFPNIGFKLRIGHFGYWKLRLSILQDFIKYIFAFVIVVFSATFTYEKGCGMQEILLSTKNGRKKYIKAKVGTAFLVTNLLCLFIIILALLPLFAVTKGVGWDTSIQMFTELMTSTLDMNNLELLFHAIFLSLVVINALLLITLSVSFLVKSPVAVMCAIFGILFFIRPDMIALLNNDTASLITSLMPSNVIDVINLAQQVPIQLGGVKIPCLTVAEVLYTLILIAGGVFFFRVLTKHQSYYAS